MMKDLLEKDFVSHYKLSASPSVSVVSTNNTSFDLKDDTTMLYPSGSGIAKYSNPNMKEVNIVNYELFIDTLPTIFTTGRERCDFIVYTSDLSYFLLNELTDTKPQYVPDFTQTDGTPRIGKRNKAISQLKKTLNDIAEVPAIKDFANKHATKHCCFFNKQSNAPISVTATIAFGRLSTLSLSGFKLSDTDIESYGFELWEFSDSQTHLLKDGVSKIQSIAQRLTLLSTKEVKELTEILKS
jgi:hypothetical protein